MFVIIAVVFNVFDCRLLQVELKFFVDSLRDLSGLEGIQIYVDYGIWTNT